MNRSASLGTLFVAPFLSAGSLLAQQQSDTGYKSISEAELRSHIYFLASDYMNGRTGKGNEATRAHFVVTDEKPGNMAVVPTFE